jgi:peptidoglycan/xylan/chitin deacetylase (PgdA/CDA1 family)
VIYAGGRLRRNGVNYSFLREVSDVVHKTRADKLIGRGYAGLGAIIMGHSVVQDANDLVDPQLQVTSRFLDLMIRYYISSNIDIISLDEAIDRLKTANKRQFVCFTFDDGYRDNLTVALPIFKKYNKPFTVYVTTTFLERRMENWRGALRETIRRHRQSSLSVAGKTFTTSTSKQKIKAFTDIIDCVANHEIHVDEVSHLLRENDIGVKDVLDADALNGGELQELSGDGLVEIGGHTDSHPGLARLSLEEARAEILANAVHLEGLTGKTVRHFAYPYGDAKNCGEREFALCKELGFATATTTRFGGLFPDHLKHSTSLPRIRLHGACESIGFMECQRNGAVAAIKTRFGRPVVSV